MEVEGGGGGVTQLCSSSIASQCEDGELEGESGRNSLSVVPVQPPLPPPSNQRR